MKKITTKTLKGLKACKEGIKWFNEKFPSGANSWDDICKVCSIPDWIGWIGVHAPSLSLKTREKYRIMSGDPDYWIGAMAVYAPNLSLTMRERYRKMSNDPIYWAGKIAAYAPGLSLKTREKYLKMSNCPKFWAKVMASPDSALTSTQREKFKKIFGIVETRRKPRRARRLKAATEAQSRARREAVAGTAAQTFGEANE